MCNNITIVSLLMITYLHSLNHDQMNPLVMFKPQYIYSQTERDQKCMNKVVDEFLLRTIDEFLEGKKKKSNNHGSFNFSGLVYCNTKKGCREVCVLLQRSLLDSGVNSLEALKVDWYHGEDDDLSKDQQKQKMEKWENNKINIMVTTAALSLGVDKANVAFVIHWDTPRDLIQVIESYFSMCPMYRVISLLIDNIMML